MVDTYSECAQTPYNTASENLLQKWNIPISHLDFGYVTQCNDSKELERIIRILRSGQEGHYPELLACVEERLRSIHPKSKALLKSIPVLNKFTCDSEEWNNICKEIQDWQEEVAVIDEDLQESKTMKIKQSLPSIRKIVKETPKDDAPKVNRIKSWDYAAWDKYDPEVELVREQLEEEKRKKEQLKKSAQAVREAHKKKSVCFDAVESLTETESIILSNREKDLGNECFKANDFEEAKKHYTSSIRLKPSAAAYNNRCITNIKLKLFKEALDDCEQVLRREPENVKGLFRKAQAYNGLKEYSNAFDTLDQLITIDPNNTSAQSLINDIRNKLTNYQPPQKQRLTIEEIDDGDVQKQTSIKKKVVVPIPSTSKFNGPCVKIMEVTEPVNDTIKSYDFKNLSKNKPAKKLQIKPKQNQTESAGKSPKIIEITDKNMNSSGEQPENTTLDSNKNFGVQKLTITEIIEDPVDAKTQINANHNPTVDTNASFYQTLALPALEEDYYENKFDRGDYIHKKNFALPAPALKHFDQENSLRNESVLPNLVKTLKIDKGGSGEPHLNADVDNLILTPYQFTKAWQGIKDRHDLVSRASVIRRIHPENLRTVIGNKMDGPMISDWLKCLQLYFCTPSDVDIVQGYLKEMVTLPRFDIIAMFMNQSDKIAVNNLISFLNQHGRSLPARVVQAFNAKF